jgi:hypothetical protein
MADGLEKTAYGIMLLLLFGVFAAFGVAIWAVVEIVQWITSK